MPDPFAKVIPGQSFSVSADTWNAMLDAGKAARDSANGGALDPRGQYRQGDIIKVKNETGTDLDRNSVVALNGPVFTPDDSVNAFLREVAFRGAVPATGDEGRFAVLLDPAADGAFGRAWVAGVCQVQVDVTDGTHTCCEMNPGDTAKLVSSDGGSAQMLWRQGGTGEQWAVIRFGTVCCGAPYA